MGGGGAVTLGCRQDAVHHSLHCNQCTLGLGVGAHAHVVPPHVVGLGVKVLDLEEQPVVLGDLLARSHQQLELGGPGWLEPGVDALALPPEPRFGLWLVLLQRRRRAMVSLALLLLLLLLFSMISEHSFRISSALHFLLSTGVVVVVLSAAFCMVSWVSFLLLGSCGRGWFE